MSLVGKMLILAAILMAFAFLAENVIFAAGKPLIPVFPHGVAIIAVILIATGIVYYIRMKPKT